MLPHDDFANVRRVLLVDSLTCAAAGGFMTLASGPLATVTELPRSLLFIAGLCLLPVSALFVWMAFTRVLSRQLVIVAVVGNIAWVIASMAALANNEPSPWGVAFVLAQALVVGVLALLEALGAQAPRQLANG